MIWLAIHTGIPPATWAAEGERAVVTAMDLLTKRDSGDQGDVQMRG